MSTESRKLQLETAVDTTGARADLGGLVDAAKSVGTALLGAGAQGKEGLDKIGSGGESATAKVERSTRSIVQSIERTTAAAKAGEKGTASYFEALATQRGADLGTLRPYLEQLRAVEEAQKKASGGLDRMGVSAAQTAAAMRSVPAQFTDIIVSLQSGQAPMTVLLQQGGQLKDMFGGTVPAVKAIGGFIASMINPMTVLAAGGAALAYAFQAGTAEARTFQATTILTGQVAGVASGRLVDMSAALVQFGRTQGQAAEVLNMLASTGAVGAANMQRFTAAALDLQRVGGPAAEETAKVFQELAKSPLEAALKLNQQTGFLTLSIYEQIRALELQGKTSEAASLAQNAYADAINNRTPQLRENLGLIEKAWLGIKGAVQGLGDDVLNVGRALGPAAQATALRNRISATRAGNFDKSELPALEAQLRTLEATAAASDKAAAAAAERAKQVKLSAEWDKEGLQYLSKSEQLQRAINKVVIEGVAAGKDSADIVQRINSLREAAADKKVAGSPADAFAGERAAAKDWASAYQSFGDAALEAEGKVGQLTKTQVELTKYLQSPGYLNMAEPARQLALEQAYAAIAAEQLAGANKAAAAAHASYVSELDKSASAAARQVQSLADEAQASALATASNISLAEAIQRVELARLQDKLAQEMSYGDDAAVAAIQREIDKRRELAELVAGKAARKASEEAASKAVGDWQRASERIEQSLTDALMRGFESGKGFAQTLRDTVVNMFKTLVLRPIVQAIVAPISGAVSAIFGGPAQAIGQAGGAATPASSAFSSLGSAAGLGGAGGLGSIFSMGAQMTGFSGAGTGIAMQGAGSMIANGSIMQGAAQGLGALAPWAAGAAAGIYGGRAISNGYAMGGGSGNSAVNVGTAIGAVIAGPIGAAIGGMLGGVANRAFGRKKENGDNGIEGSVGGGAATGEQYQDWVKKGGWFRSDKRGTDKSTMSQELDGLLDAGAGAILEQTKNWAKVLSLPADVLAGVTTQFKVKLTGDAKADEAAIAGILEQYQSGLSAKFNVALQPFQKVGESLSDTLKRMSGVQIFSDSINQMGGIFSKIAQASVDAKEGLINLAGGVESFGQQAAGFVQNYYSRDEIAGGKAAEAQKALAAVGITQDISAADPRAQFRALVEGSDVNTEAGSKRLAALLGIQDQFAGLADYLEQSGKSLSQAAAGAPSIAVLGPLLSNGTAQQVQATNLVKDAIDSMHDTLQKLFESQGGAGQSGNFVSNRWREVGVAP